ncbi:MAG: aspartate ammonia-lyase [Tissierellia bacterium]|nr:aspartate ammonia-lyase [Tissierellia bacterium]
MDYRLESDSIGEKQVDSNAYYGVQSLRGKENFDITGKHTHREMINALANIKKACAIANNMAGVLEDDKKEAIVYACEKILKGEYHDQFITDMIQGGAGTTHNMNANEVIANIANEKMGGGLGSYEYIHPNDHVNMSQSTNDVFPTSGKIATLVLSNRALDELNLFIKSLERKSEEFDDVLKMGRTQLQDAVPIRLGQEFHAYASVMKRDVERISAANEKIKYINMGATAIGTGINVDPVYFKNITPIISELTGFDLKQAKDLIDATNNLDSLVEISSAYKNLATNLSKIASDLRLMSSGPKTMVSDIILPARQNGSSIMPGKVNPVIPEVVNQVAFRIIGNDMTITMCSESGQLELNAFEPVLFYSLFESIEIVTNALKTFRINCVDGIKANREELKRDVELSVGVVTALVPHIGYRRSADIAKESLKTGKTIKEIILENKLLTEDELQEILDPVSMTRPGIAAEHLIKKKLRKELKQAKKELD